MFVKTHENYMYLNAIYEVSTGSIINSRFIIAVAEEKNASCHIQHLPVVFRRLSSHRALGTTLGESRSPLKNTIIPGLSIQSEIMYGPLLL